MFFLTAKRSIRSKSWTRLTPRLRLPMLRPRASACSLNGIPWKAPFAKWIVSGRFQLLDCDQRNIAFSPFSIRKIPAKSSRRHCGWRLDLVVSYFSLKGKVISSKPGSWSSLDFGCKVASILLGLFAPLPAIERYNYFWWETSVLYTKSAQWTPPCQP